MNKLDLLNFNVWQLMEIKLGLEEGIDVSVYAKPEFVPYKMYLIRQGLESGLSADESIKQANTTKVNVFDTELERIKLRVEIDNLSKANTERG